MESILLCMRITKETGCLLGMSRGSKHLNYYFIQFNCLYIPIPSLDVLAFSSINTTAVRFLVLNNYYYYIVFIIVIANHFKPTVIKNKSETLHAMVCLFFT